MTSMIILGFTGITCASRSSSEAVRDA